MKNKLIDLNNHLFAQLERLSGEDLTPEQIEREVMRTKAIVTVSEQIISTANIALEGAKLVAEQYSVRPECRTRLSRSGNGQAQ